MKRTDYINWDEYFMGIALLTAMRSKDPNSQVGACIVSPENKILSLGYNGMPIGCDDDAMPWDREGEPLDTKYMYVCHAELNAILNSAHNNLKGARVYVVGAEGVAKSQPVTAGMAVGEDVVIASGLAAGAVVVVEGADRLRDGAKVTIRNNGPATAAKP